MFTDNTIHKINKNNPAEMYRNGSKAYRVLQFPVIACLRYLILLFREKNSIKRGNRGIWGKIGLGVQIGEC